MKSVYLAGPINGLDFDGATGWRNYVEVALRDCGIVGLSPMRAKEFLRNVGRITDSYEEFPLASQSAIVGRDRNDVMTCDLMLANFLGAEKVSAGTPIEFGWADAYRKPIILVMEPEGNLYDHPMIRGLAAVRLSNLDDAILTIRAILNVTETRLPTVS